jgi:malonyl-CoA O-methyltransferase
MTQLFDRRHVRRAFSRAARSYEASASLQHAIEAQLLDSLSYRDSRPDAAAPQVVVDLGCGPAHAAAAMQQRWPKARVLALDLALPMLQAGVARKAWNPLRRRVQRVCADAAALPLADTCVDVLFSNLCLQWVDDLPAVLAGFRRVLKPGGLLLLSSFGPETLHELREAFAAVDAVPHVSPFAGIAQWGDALMAAGFRDPVLDRDVIQRAYADLPSLMRELRAIGATNALHARRHSLTGKSRWARAIAAYPSAGDGTSLHATWETITAMAWGPPAGAPVRDGNGEIARFPAHGIPVRRR